MNKKEEMKKNSNLIRNCRKCTLWKNRKNPVPGKGSLEAEILFIGEAPGRNEDIKGEPFVGRAGKILDELLSSIDLLREEVFITNILKCRPPKNRNPMKNEIKKCTGYLNKQIAIIKPKIISPLGSFSSNYIFKKFGLKQEKISTSHGKIIDLNTVYGNLKLIPLYHPAVATYNPNKKDTLLKDIKKIKQTL